MNALTKNIRHIFEDPFAYKLSGFSAYLLAATLSVIALFVRLEIAPIGAGLQYVIFFPAVTLACLFGGYRAGLFAVAISLCFATYIFTPPHFTISLEVFWKSLWANLVFLFDGVIVAFSIEAMHRYREKSQLKFNLLSESEKHFRDLFEHFPVAYQSLDNEGRYLDVNQRMSELLGYEQEEILGNSFSDRLSKESQLLFEELLSHFNCSGLMTTELELKRKDDSFVTVLFSCSMQCDKSGAIVQVHCILHDITERKKIEDDLRIASVTFETSDAIMITDADAKIIRVNRAFEDITGYSADEVLGKNPKTMSSGKHDKEFFAQMWQQLLKEGFWTGEIWDRHKSGRIYPKNVNITMLRDSQEQSTGYVAIFSDITERKHAEQEIYDLAFYDPLTTLSNRRMLLDRLRHAVSSSDRNEMYGAIIFLDMDKFKILNDTLGHNYGDLMLIEVAERTKHCVRNVDTVSRIGGDEFIVLFENLSLSEKGALRKAALLAEKIRASLAAPYQIKDHIHYSSPSIGVCLFLGGAVSVDDLLKRADVAMYRAKNSGRNTICFYDPKLQQEVETHATFESDLRKAILERQLRLYYQIQLDENNHPLGAEALIRWLHPERGIISPLEFIPIAEESNLIFDIGSWVIDTACQQLAEWRGNEQTKGLQLAVNVSAHQFKMPNFVESVENAIKSHGVDATKLKLELTESVVLNDITDVVLKMNLLKKMGITLSLDDFGTGYSSLAYLSQLPIDQLKIDQGFMQNITTNLGDAIMVKSIIELSKNFNLHVIAEGVETVAQCVFLKENGCFAFQGFLFSKPVPIGEFETLLQYFNDPIVDTNKIKSAKRFQLTSPQI